MGGFKITCRLFVFSHIIDFSMSKFREIGVWTTGNVGKLIDQLRRGCMHSLSKNVSKFIGSIHPNKLNLDHIFKCCKFLIQVFFLYIFTEGIPYVPKIAEKKTYLNGLLKIPSCKIRGFST